MLDYIQCYTGIESVAGQKFVNPPDVTQQILVVSAIAPSLLESRRVTI
jgi:hypothetical protein